MSMLNSWFKLIMRSITFPRFLHRKFTFTNTGASLYSSQTGVPCTLRFVSNCALADWYVTAVSDPQLACFSWLKIVSIAEPLARRDAIKDSGCSLRDSWQ